MTLESLRPTAADSRAVGLLHCFLKVMKCGSVDGSVEMWKCGSVEVWMEVWKFSQS